MSGFCLHLVLGSLFTWGSLLPYIASKLHSINPETTLESTLFFIPICALSINLTLPLGGFLEKILNKKVVLLIGTSFIAIGNIICAYGNDIFIILLGDFIIGSGTGLAYMIPIKNVWLYFPEQKGLVSGVIVCGFGLSSFIFSFISKSIVNPHNEESDKNGFFKVTVYSKVTDMFLYLAIIYSILCVTSVMLFIPFEKEFNNAHNDEVEEMIKKNNVEVFDYNTISNIGEKEPKAITEEKEDIKDPIEISNNGNKNNSYVSNSHIQHENPNETLFNALFSKQFLMLFFMPFMSFTFGLFVVNSIKLFGRKSEIDDLTLTWASSLSGLGNGITRPVWGYLFDMWKFKKTYTVLCVFQFILAATIYFTPLIDKYLFVFWCFLTLSAEGCHFTILPAVTQHVFGQKLATEVYGFVFYS